jgi:hypothetical protein
LLTKEQVDAIRWYTEKREHVNKILDAVRKAETALETVRQEVDAGDTAISEQVPAGYYLVDGRLVKITPTGVYLPLMETYAPDTDVLGPVDRSAGRPDAVSADR